MTMNANGSASPELEDEATHFSNPEDFSNPETHYSNPEWETHYSNPEDFSNPYSNPEWETHYSNPEDFSNPYSNPEWETHYSNPEDFSNPYSNPEWETHYSNPEDFSNPYSNPEWETQYSNPEDFSNPYSSPEWETHYSNPEDFSNPYSNPEYEDEADRFLPFLAPLAMKALPLLGKAVMPLAKKLIPFGKRAVGNVVRNVLGGARRGGAGMRPRPRPGGMAPGPAAPRPAAAPGGAGQTASFITAIPPQQRATVAGLFRQLGALFGEAESETAEMEAQMFGANEFEGELAAHEGAHEAALTEVLAAEAAHTESESEAEALLGAALPITIRIMGGGSSLRGIAPTLATANARLVRGIRSSSPAGRQLLRTVPAIQRRTVATLRAAQRAGQPVTPALAARAMAGQAARVLGTPHICGRSIVRNAAIRRATVAPTGAIVRPARRVRAGQF